MPLPRWVPLGTITVKAKPENAIWQLAHEFVQGPGLLKVVARGGWKYSNLAKECSANGDLDSPLDNRGAVYEKAPLGALIGRIGGSIADSDGAFVVGTLCVHKLDKDAAGPFFLAINDKRNGFEDNDGELTVEISHAKDPALPTPAGE